MRRSSSSAIHGISDEMKYLREPCSSRKVETQQLPRGDECQLFEVVAYVRAAVTVLGALALEHST